MTTLTVRVHAAAEAIRSAITVEPRIFVIAGSGLGGLAGRIESATSIPYGDIPHFPRAAVPGHDGVLHVGTLGRYPIAVAAGRVHMYEGYTAAEVALSVRVLAELGAATLLVTNAAGGLNPEYSPGDLMVIADHIFLPGMAGAHPLAGADWDGRFVPMKDAYDARLGSALQSAAASHGLTAHLGVYAMVTGPTFETPAEARALRALGADAVGMSTAPEVVVARSLGMQVAAASVITNMVETAAAVAPRRLPQEGERGSHVAPVPGHVCPQSSREGPEPIASPHVEVLGVSARVAPVVARVVEAWVGAIGGGSAAA